jgi:hypothetical protein
VGREYRYASAQASFHMTSFRRSRLADRAAAKGA